MKPQPNHNNSILIINSLGIFCNIITVTLKLIDGNYFHAMIFTLMIIILIALGKKDFKKAFNYLKALKKYNLEQKETEKIQTIKRFEIFAKEQHVKNIKEKFTQL